MIPITLIENDVKSFQTPMEAEMQKALKHFESELLKVRTGRAHTSLVEDVHVAVYGAAPAPLKHLAVLSAPEPRLIIIQPWDAGLIDAIEKAIMNSELGLTPINDGALIRLQLPEMSTTRRDELVKILGKRTTEAKERIRDVRKDFNNLIREAKKNKKISENFFDRLEDVLEKVSHKFTETADQLMEKKEKDIRAV
jgi:ribosome recycling factor